MRLLITPAIFAAILLTWGTDARAQGGKVECSNNLKQLGLAIHNSSESARSSALTGTFSDVMLCTDGTNLYVQAGDLAPVKAQVQGCAANVAEIGFGDRPQVTSRRQADGRISMRVSSSQQSGCWMAVILPQMDQGPLYDRGRDGIDDVIGATQAKGTQGSLVATAGKPPGREPPATATITLPDLIPVNNGLQLGSKVIPWGQTATISTDEASSKQGGRCEFRYKYGTTNAGQAGAGPAANLILLNAVNGPVLANAPLPALAVAAQHTSSGTVQLVPGTWTLYVHVDGQTQVIETDDKNNVQRVRVQVDGKCD